MDYKCIQNWRGSLNHDTSKYVVISWSLLMSNVVVENEFLTGNVASNLESRVILYDMQLFERSRQ